MSQNRRKKGDPLLDPLRARVEAISQRVRRQPLGRPPSPNRGKRRTFEAPADPEAE